MPDMCLTASYAIVAESADAAIDALAGVLAAINGVEIPDVTAVHQRASSGRKPFAVTKLGEGLSERVFIRATLVNLLHV